MKKIALIAAMANNRVIGLRNTMPWHMPADLKHFKALTLGKPIIMGRKTFESIGGALPGRDNIVISNHADYQAKGATVYTGLSAALDAIDAPEVMVIGGGQLFIQAFPLAETMYLTLLDLDVEGDAFFPEWDSSEWEVVSQEAHERDGKNAYAYTFIELKRHL